MKRIFTALFLIFVVTSAFSQIKINRTVVVKPFIDTTTAEFRGIFGLWERYMDTLYVYTVKSHFKIKETNESINSFWSDYDKEHYSFPDLAQSLTAAAMSFYPIEDEYFLGFSHRDTNLFELKTMFISLNEKVFHNTPDIIISQPVIKVGNTYKLYNKFSWLLEWEKIIEQKIGNITYYYSPTYKFNNKDADLLADRIQQFITGFQIEDVPEIKYLVGDNMTELYSWLGIDYYNIDFNGTLMSRVAGRAVPLNNMILSGNGGENYMHEIIHILLKDMRKGRYGYFEEGIACYFGEHVGHSYAYHVKRLKKYFEKNKWIDLSENLENYYKNTETDHSYEPLKGNLGENYKAYGDGETNFTYIINAVLCDMAFREGGYDLVKKMLIAKADNVEEFYPVIEKYLGIKRKRVDREIKRFIDQNY